MGKTQQAQVSISPAFLKSVSQSLPINLSQQVPDLASRYLKISGVTKAQDFMAAQIGLASKYLSSIQNSVAPLVKWAKSPEGRCERFMFKRSQIGQKFSKLVSTPLEFLALIQELVTAFFNSKLTSNSQNLGRRAQIMSIRGLALSCAPNFSRKGDIKSMSRSYSGLHISLVA